MISKISACDGNSEKKWKNIHTRAHAHTLLAIHSLLFRARKRIGQVKYIIKGEEEEGRGRVGAQEDARLRRRRLRVPTLYGYEKENPIVLLPSSTGQLYIVTAIP